MNSDYLYSLSSDTISYVKGLKDDITIYYLVEDGHEAQTSSYTKTINVENIIKLYDGLGTVKVEKKNPVLYPNFAKKYTSESVKDNDMIVVNNKNGKSQYLSFQSDMIEMTYDTSSGSMEQVPKSLKLESAVTSAIQKVTLKNTKKVYVGGGHSMQSLNDDFTELLSKNGLEKEDFDLTKNTKVPDDCSLLILYSPAADITENEYKYLSTYLKNGGKAIFLLNYTVDTPYYNKLLKDYGINVQSGYVLDPDNYFASYGSGAYMLLTPQVSKDSDLTSDSVSYTHLDVYKRQGAFHGVTEGDAVINVGVSGPGVVKTALDKVKGKDFSAVCETIKKTAFKITRVGQLVAHEASKRLGVPFGIIDLSLAPTPAVGDSIAEIFESLGLERAGAPGTTAALAMLNDQDVYKRQVFVVGGGGKHEGFTEILAHYLGLPNERVAIRGAEVLSQVQFEQEGIRKDSTLVTPLGICMTYYEQKNNFIHVMVNEQRVKLYDNGKVSVLDACVSYGFSKDRCV